MDQYYVYILSNNNRTVLYIGYTENIQRRIKQHVNGKGALFTKKYNATELIYIEEYDDIKKAKKRERQLKNWNRDWKWELVKKSNPSLNKITI